MADNVLCDLGFLPFVPSSHSKRFSSSCSSLNSESSAELRSQTDSLLNEISERSLVKFGSVTLRHYDQTVGDHPLCEGPALALDWFYTEDEERPSVDDYESKRRSSSVLCKLTSPSEKTSMLMNHGLSMDEISTTMQDLRVANKQSRKLLRGMKSISKRFLGRKSRSCHF